MKTQANPAAAAANVPPLTCCGANGEPPFDRFTDVQREIAVLLSLSPECWPEQVEKGTRLCDETLVHLVRRLRAQDNKARLGPILQILMDRTARIVEHWAQGLSAAQLEGIETVVTVSIVGRLLSPEITRSSEYLEASYSTAVKNLTLKEVDKVRRRRDVDRPQPDVFNDDGARLDPVAMIVDERPDALDALIASREHHPTIRELLRAVTDVRHRRAFILRKLRNWPYQPGIPPKPCLCTTFDKSERQIRSWIATAKDQMRKAYGDRT